MWKRLVAAFNHEKALVGAFSVITNLRMEIFDALHQTPSCGVTSQIFTLCSHTICSGTSNHSHKSHCLQKKISKKWWGMGNESSLILLFIFCWFLLIQISNERCLWAGVCSEEHKRVIFYGIFYLVRNSITLILFMVWLYRISKHSLDNIVFNKKGTVKVSETKNLLSNA